MVASLLIPGHRASADGDDLGAGLTVIPTSDGTDADLGGNNRLWFNSAPGGAATRKFVLTSQSLVEQSVSLEILNLLVVDGTAQIDPGGTSAIKDWVSFDPPTAVLPPQGNLEVTMSIEVPNDAETGQYRAYLRVGLSLAGEASPDSAVQGPAAVVKNVLAFAQDIWLGVGASDGEPLTTNFEIDGVQGILDAATGNKFLRIRFSNVGQTPVGIEGTVELRNQDFDNLNIGPLNYNTGEILPGARGFVDVELDQDTIEGRWQVLVRALQGQILKTEIFEEDLRFTTSGSESSTRNLIVRIGIFLLGVVLLFLSTRLLRGSNNKRNKKRTPSSGASTLAKAIDPPPLLPSTNAPEGERGNQSDAENVTDDLRSNFAQAESQTKDVTSTPPDPSPRDERSESTTVVTVHVIGAVRAPGVYELPLGSRVNDAVERAGGPSIVADLSGTNLARKLVDGEQVNIPKRVVGVRENQPIATPEILDLNLASAEQLAGLPGIGMDLAKAIVAHRRRIGQFANVNQLLDVKGIGERKFAAIKGRLRT
ncbi:MAG: helix-hairpin-helix domain-containing protein [Ilumatobacteraceae bacterium]